MFKKITRQDAELLRVSRYFTGKACKHGHVCERMVSTHACVGCLKVRKKYPRHIKRRLERIRERYAIDVEFRLKIKLAAKKFLKTPAGKKANFQKQLRYRLANAEKIKARKREIYALNPKKANHYWHERRARLLKAKGSFSALDIQMIQAKQHNKCWCGESFSNVSFTIDHKRPLSRGGSNYPSNLQLLCGSCNDSKSTKTMSEWLKWLKLANRLPSQIRKA